MLEIGSLVAVYFVLWWLSLIIVLPFGSHSQAESGEIDEGTEPGAPSRMRFWPKALAATIMAAVLMPIVLWAVSLPWLQSLWQ